MSTTFESKESLLDKLPAEPDDAEQDSRQLLERYDESMCPRGEGEIVPGRVVAVTSSAVLVDVGHSSAGRVPIKEFTDSEGNLTVEVGDEVDVLIEKIEDLEGHLLLSWKKAQRMRRWAEVERAYEEGRILKGRVFKRIKGGLAVDVFGFRAFLPGLHVDIRQTHRLERLCGQELEFKIINVNRRRYKIVLSRKDALEILLQKRRAETLARLEEGAQWRGVVKKIVDYGVFINLGGIDGLLHVNNISCGRFGHLSEQFSVGDEVEVVVLQVDRVTQRISLGYQEKSEQPPTSVLPHSLPPTAQGGRKPATAHGL